MGIIKKLFGYEEMQSSYNQTITHIFVLVHPYCDFGMYTLPEQHVKFKKLWEQSIKDASADSGCFAVLYLNDRGKNPTIEEVRKMYLPEDELNIAELIHAFFGRERYLFIAAMNLYFPGLVRHPSIDGRFDSETVEVSIRGVYADRCVDDAKKGIRDAYGIPPEHITILYEESVFAEKKFADEHGFLDNLLKRT